MEAKIRELGCPLSGFDAYVTSTVLSGSGLSSSAAYEVLVGNILNRFCCGGELDAVADCLASGGDLRSSELTEKHADWAEGFAPKYTVTRENALDSVQKETGLVFAQVLEHAGVYKRTPQGKEAFLRFLDCI